MMEPHEMSNDAIREAVAPIKIPQYILDHLGVDEVKGLLLFALVWIESNRCERRMVSGEDVMRLTSLMFQVYATIHGGGVGDIEEDSLMEGLAEMREKMKDLANLITLEVEATAA